MRLHAVLALAACLAPAAAIFEDDAYHIDFHYALIGRPKHDATFFQKPYAGSKASLLYTISQNQTVGAVNPKDGALVWRQAPPAATHGRGTLRAGEDQDTVVSAVGDRITAWSASDGRIVWETAVDGAIVEDLEILEQEDGITNTEAKDMIVLLAEKSQGVKRLDGKTGRVKWSYQDTRQASHRKTKSFRSTANIMQQWRHAVSGLDLTHCHLLHLVAHAHAWRIYQAASDIPQPDNGQAA
jgi:outer membrane protein assembly factor BamB